jgi:hypothetical protein
MQTKSLIKALDKAGLKVEKTGPRSHYVTNGILEASWIDQEGKAICLHVQRVGTEQNPYDDYLPGVFLYKIKHLIASLTAKTQD